MLSVSAGRGGWLRPPALAAALLAPLSLGTMPAGAAPPVRIVACHPESLSEAALANGILGDKPVAPIPDDEANDQDEEDQQPRITGSIPKPADVGEDDSKKLESLGLATVTREQALDKARWAVADPSQCKFRRPKL